MSVVDTLLIKDMRVILTVFLLVQIVKCARILGVFHSPLYSHFVLGEVLFKELAARGHEVTVVSGFPLKEELKNYKDVPLTAPTEYLKVMPVRPTVMTGHWRAGTSVIMEAFDFGLQLTIKTLEDPAMQNLLNSNETYDVIILEQFLNEAHFGIVHRFNAPVILFSTCSSSLWTNILMGNPTPFAYIPNFLMDFPPRMNFLQRAYNTFISTFQNIYFYTYLLPQHEAVMHKYIPDAPPIEDLMYNATLMLLNSHPTVGSPVALQPNMIEIGGFHVMKSGKLPDDLKKYLDEATEGVVYFAMGSNLKSRDLPVERRDAILMAFSKLKMKVLWKWEDDKLPGKPDNVRIEKWLPQPAVLDHKNVKIFISHGGRLSTIEAVYFGKPILGIPIFADQFANIEEAVHGGYGRHLSFLSLDEEHLLEVLNEMIENPKYAKEAKYRSDALRTLQNPLETAIQWTEYVVRHKGVPHLRNVGIELTWYQLLLLDVALFYFIGIWLIVKVIRVILRRLLNKPGREQKKVKRS